MSPQLFSTVPRSLSPISETAFSEDSSEKRKTTDSGEQSSYSSSEGKTVPTDDKDIKTSSETAQ